MFCETSDFTPSCESGMRFFTFLSVEFRHFCLEQDENMVDFPKSPNQNKMLSSYGGVAFFQTFFLAAILMPGGCTCTCMLFIVYTRPEVLCPLNL